MRLDGTGDVTINGIKKSVADTKAALAVMTATAAGATDSTVSVVFNKELDASTVVNANFVFGGASAPTVEDVELGADKKTVTITFDGTIADTYTLKATTGVKDYAGLAIGTTNGVTFGTTVTDQVSGSTIS